MASDGLWDVMGNQEACTLARKCLLRARQRGSSRQVGLAAVWQAGEGAWCWECPVSTGEPASP